MYLLKLYNVIISIKTRLLCPRYAAYSYLKLTAYFRKKKLISKSLKDNVYNNLFIIFIKLFTIIYFHVKSSFWNLNSTKRVEGPDIVGRSASLQVHTSRPNTLYL